MSETRDALEAEIGARAVGTIAVDGRNVPVAFAANEEQVVGLLALAAARDWRVLPIGSGTKLEHGPLRAKPRFAISLRGWSGITAFERGDGTLSARAGSTMAALAQAAASAGMHVTPDVAGASQATLGGTLGAGASGVDRLRCGPVRHHVLGMRVALADGSITKTGGRLVKNVTGYDLHRLYTGSRGSLCVILEATLRLCAAPERVVWLEAHYHGRDAALTAATTAARGPFGAWTVAVTGTNPGPWTLGVALAGRREATADACDRLRATLGATTLREDAAARAAWNEVRDAELATRVRVGVLPGELPRALATIDAWTSAHGVPAGLVVHPGIATIDVAWPEANANTSAPTSTHGTSPDAVLPQLVRELVQGPGGVRATVELRAGPTEVRASFDPRLALPDAVRDLNARLSSALDPHGRFVGARVAAGRTSP